MPVDERFREAVCAAALDNLAEPLIVETPRDGRTVILAGDHVITITTDGQVHDLELDGGELTVLAILCDFAVRLEAQGSMDLDGVTVATVKSAREKIRARL